MKNYLALPLSLILGSLLAAPMAHAMSKDEYKAAKDRTALSYKSDKAACATLAGNAKDICKEEALAKRNNSRAEAGFAYSGKAPDGIQVRVVRAEGVYAVARERCDDLAGNERNVCVQQAKAVKTKALVDARVTQQISDARKDGALDKVDADFRVAMEKCEVFSGDAKSACAAQARTAFNKP